MLMFGPKSLDQVDKDWKGNILGGTAFCYAVSSDPIRGIPESMPPLKTIGLYRAKAITVLILLCFSFFY